MPRHVTIGRRCRRALLRCCAAPFTAAPRFHLRARSVRLLRRYLPATTSQNLTDMPPFFFLFTCQQLAIPKRERGSLNTAQPYYILAFTPSFVRINISVIHAGVLLTRVASFEEKNTGSGCFC